MATFSTHSFSVELAVRIGLREAIVLQHFYWWHQHNSALPQMNIEGRVWFFISASQIAEAFPYLSVKMVRGIIDKFVSEGYLLKDHKGDGANKFNRTNWYALTPAALVYFDLPKGESPFAPQGKSISYNNSSITSPNGESIYISNPLPPTKKFNFREAVIGLGVEPELCDEWLQVRKAKKGVNTQTAFKSIAEEITKSGKPAAYCIHYAVVKSWAGFKAAWLEEEEKKFTSTPAPSPRRKVDEFEHMMEVGRELGIIGGQADEQ